MTLRFSDVLFRAGGRTLERHGVLVQRLRQGHEILEEFTAADPRFRMDRNGVVRQAETDVPRLDWAEVDGSLKPLLALEKELTHLVEFSIPGGTAADFELTPMGVANQTGEFYLQLDEGDDAQVAEANLGAWDPNDSLFAVWGRPAFASDDGATHYLAWANGNSNNEVTLRKDADGAIKARIELGGSAILLTLTPSSPWAAGDEVYIGLRLESGGNATLYYDTDGNATLETDTAALPGVADDLTWTLNVGQDSAGVNEWEGGLNLAILNVGSSADPITHRFNGGAGEDIQTWLRRIHPDTGHPLAHHLVAYLPKSSDGAEVEPVVFDGESLLDLTGASGHQASVPDDAAISVTGDIDARAKGLPDDPSLSSQQAFFGKWGGGGYIFAVWNGKLWFEWTDSSGFHNEQSTVAAPTTAGLWYRATLDVDNGSGAYEVKFYTSSDYDPDAETGTWDQLGSTVTGGDTTTIEDTANDLFLGSYNGSGYMYEGPLRHAQVFDGIGGTKVLDVDFTKVGPGRSSFVCSTGQTVSVNGGAAIRLDPDQGSQLLSNTGFEDYSATGAYLSTDGINDFLTTGDPGAGADGLTKVTWGLVFRAESSNTSQRIFDRFDGADNQFAIVGGPGTVQVRIADAGGDNANGKEWTGLGFSQDEDVEAFIVYDGSQATSADRLALYWRKRDPATGTWGATNNPAGSEVGTIPASLRDSALGYKWFKAGGFGNHSSGIVVDETKVWNGVALSAAEVEAESVYQAPQTAGADHHWTFDDLTDSVGSLDASVTGSPSQVADGRKPTVWNVGSDMDEVDRATGASNRAGGTYGARLKIDSNAPDDVEQTGLSVTAGRWYLATVNWRETAGSIQLQLPATGFGSNIKSSAPLFGSLKADAIFGEATTTTNAQRVQIILNDDGTEGYVDDVTFYELAEPGFSTLTKGGSFPLLNGFGGAWGVADAELVDFTAESLLTSDPYDSALGVNVVKLTTGPAGASERAYRLGFPGEMNGFTAGAGGGAGVQVFVPAGSDVDPATVKLRLVDDVGASESAAAGVAGEWVWLEVSRAWDGAATEAYVELVFEDGTDPGSADAVLYMALPTVVAEEVLPRPYANTAEGTVTVGVEDFRVAFDVPPQGLTFFLDVVERGTARLTNARLLQWGDAANNRPRLYVFGIAAGAQYRVAVDVSATDVVTSTMTQTVATAQRIRLALDYYPDGSSRLRSRVGAGAVEDAGRSDPVLEPPEDFSGELLHLGGVGGSSAGVTGLLDAIAVLGNDHAFTDLEDLAT